MRTLGNILWLIFGGLFVALGTFVTGLLLCLTIILIPIGLQYFKLGAFLLWPLGKEVKEVSETTLKQVVNIIYAIFFGWILFLYYGAIGVLLCITIILIPVGLQFFKVARFAITPLGYDFV